MILVRLRLLGAFFHSCVADRPGIFRLSYAAVDLCATPTHARYRTHQELELVAASSLPRRVFLVSRMACFGACPPRGAGVNFPALVSVFVSWRWLSCCGVICSTVLYCFSCWVGRWWYISDPSRYSVRCSGSGLDYPPYTSQQVGSFEVCPRRARNQQRPAPAIRRALLWLTLC